MFKRIVTPLPHLVLMMIRGSRLDTMQDMYQNKVQKIKKSKKNRYLSTARKSPVDRCIQARKPYLRTGVPVDSTSVAC
ncbi:hypothetical protein Taro_054898 [Colocasia esculenta]|uniref:Uncharacterized protein n=1 Tax=Colocasia esculenta TaxID=4460 RepID=A0A843XRR5_COLES|nr:hypothetical protein [Colocasia esculenta]